MRISLATILRGWFLLPLLLAVSIAPSRGQVAASADLIEVGKPFPLVRLPVVGEDESFDSLEAYRGRKVMLHLFASW